MTPKEWGRPSSEAAGRRKRGKRMIAEMTKQAGCTLAERVKIAAAILAMHHYDYTQAVVGLAGEIKTAALYKLGQNLSDDEAMQAAMAGMEDEEANRSLAGLLGRGVDAYRGAAQAQGDFLKKIPGAYANASRAALEAAQHSPLSVLGGPIGRAGQGIDAQTARLIALLKGQQGAQEEGFSPSPMQSLARGIM